MNLTYLKALRAQLNYSYTKKYRMNKKMIQLAHEVARSKGFWDTDRDVIELINLVRSEIGELLEAHRDGKHQPGASVVKEALSLLGTPAYAQFYKDNMKGYCSEELADVVLRCYDLIGSNEDYLELFMLANKSFESTGDFHKELDRAYRFSARATSRSKKIRPHVMLVTGIHGVVCSMQNIAKILNINLDEAVEMKLEFNRTRPHKHGRNY